MLAHKIKFCFPVYSRGAGGGGAGGGGERRGGGSAIIYMQKQFPYTHYLIIN